MGRLSGFKYRKIIKVLKELGFEFHRQAAGSHEIWFNAQTNHYTTIPKHTGDLPEGTLRAILKQANITRFFTKSSLNKLSVCYNRLFIIYIVRAVVTLAESFSELLFLLNSWKH